MRTMWLRSGSVAALLVVALGIAVVPADARGDLVRARPAVAATTTAKVKIVDFAFKPKALTVAKGTRVKWVNTGSVSHTTTSNTGLWNSGPIAPGGSFSRVFKKAGTFKFHCAIHPTMVGKIVVS